MKIFEITEFDMSDFDMPDLDMPDLDMPDLDMPDMNLSKKTNPTKQKGTGSPGVYKILDQKTGKVQGPKGIEYFPVSADGNVIWNRKALPGAIPGTIGSKEIAIRNLQLQGFKIGGDHMKGDSEYSKDTKGNWVTRKQADDDDWKVNTVAPADKANAANDAYYKKRNRDIAKRMGFDSPRAAKDAFNKMSTSKKAELQKIYNQEIADYGKFNETTSSASISVAPTGIGGMQKRNPDGTAVNALDQDNLLGGKPKKKKNKSKQSVGGT